MRTTCATPPGLSTRRHRWPLAGPLHCVAMPLRLQRGWRFNQNGRRVLFDVVIVGAGAAGLFCAGVAGQLGLKVLLLDHSEKVAEKIRISGGGRCNFTNREATPANFVSANPHFCRSALSRYTPQDFIALVKQHGVAHHEKHKGQLFCDHSADDIIQMLLRECTACSVTHWQPCRVAAVRTGPSGYQIDSERGVIDARAVVVATGGLSIPKIGATDFGHRIARQFDLRVTELRPALVPLTFDGGAWLPYAQLAGLSLPVAIETGEKKAKTLFMEDLLFTHRGLSGPAVFADLQLLARGCSDPAQPRPPSRPAPVPERREGALPQADRQRIGWPAARPLGRCLGAAGPRLAAPGERRTRQGAGVTRRAFGALGIAADRHRGATERRKSRSAGWIRAICRRKPWNPGNPACTSLARWWT